MVSNRTLRKKVKPYDGFSLVFDNVVKKKKYTKWYRFIREIWNMNKLKPKTLVDLACGTGNNSIIYAKKNIKVQGIDQSKKMLKIARSKKGNRDIKYTLASFDNFKIPAKVDAAICLDFSTNYILSKRYFVKFLKRVYTSLKPGGIFIFDFKPTEAYLKKELHLKKKRFSFDCVFDIKNKPFVKADIIVNIIKGKKNMSFIEKHLERGYNLKEMKKIVNKTDFDIIGFFDNCNPKEPAEECELIQVALRKNLDHSL